MCGLPAAPSLIVTAPVRVPVAVGVNLTLILQLDPAASDEPHVVVSEKSPLAAMLVMVSDALPEFVSVTVCAVLVVPTVMPPPEATNVAMTDVRASVAEAVAVAVCVPVVVTILSSEIASVPDALLGDDRGSPYPAPVVHAPDPFCRANRAKTYSLGEAVGAVVETVPTEALD
jgi:hypothetical protein